jgi:hypothetical protein
MLAAAFCLLLSLCACSACALIVLRDGRERPRVQTAPRLDQSSPQAVVRLFLHELDSANVYGALYLMSAEDRLLLATEKREMQEDIARYARMFGGKKITLLNADTLASTKQRVRAELNYTRELVFTTVKFDEAWFIASLTQPQADSAGNTSTKQ